MDPATLKALIASLLAWINLNAGYEIPQPDPVIAFVPQPALEQMACTGRCPIFGLYRDAGVIYLDARLRPETNVCARSILLHELVHFVQHASDRFAGLQAETSWQIREIEAYAIQNRFLAQHERRIRVGRPAGAATAYVGPTC